MPSPRPPANSGISWEKSCSKHDGRNCEGHSGNDAFCGSVRRPLLQTERDADGGDRKQSAVVYLERYKRENREPVRFFGEGGHYRLLDNVVPSMQRVVQRAGETAPEIRGEGRRGPRCQHGFRKRRGAKG